MIKCSAMSAPSTRRVATTACTMPMTVACLPIVFRSDNLNSLPIENAMKPSATSDMIDMDLISSNEVNPSPLTPACPRQKGPTSMPATRYAVTAGSFKTFARRDNKRPTISAMARLNKISILCLLF